MILEKVILSRGKEEKSAPHDGFSIFRLDKKKVIRWERKEGGVVS